MHLQQLSRLKSALQHTRAFHNKALSHPLSPTRSVQNHT